MASSDSGDRRLRVWVVVIIVLIALMVIPTSLSSYTIFRLDLIALYAATAAGMNLAVGIAGELMFGQATVLAAGAYAAGMANVHLSVSPFVTLPIAVAAAVVMSCVIGFVGIRVGGFYLAVISFFSTLVLADAAQFFESVTGGVDGLQGIAPLTFFGTRVSAATKFYLCVAILLASFVLVWRVVRSGLGIQLKSLRDSPSALSMSGIDVRTTKMLVYALSAIPAGLAAWMLVYLNRFVGASLFGVSLTLLFVAGLELGGRGALFAPIAGVALVTGYSFLVGPFSQYNTLGLGVCLLLAVVVVPGGLVTLYPERFRTARRHGEVDAEASPTTASARHPEAAELRVTAISKSFGGVPALRDISLTLEPGRVLALIGPNGSGKTTLLNVVSGVVQPDAGSVTIGGASTLGWPSYRIARAGLSRTFQIPRLVDELTVRENIEVGLLRSQRVSLRDVVLRSRRFRVREHHRRTEAGNVAALASIPSELLDVPAATLSLGMKRVVEVARTVATGASVLCLDEPAAGLNSDEIDRLALLLHDLRAAGFSVLVVEHNDEFVRRVCDDIVLLDAGSVHAIARDARSSPLPGPISDYLRLASDVDGSATL